MSGLWISTKKPRNNARTGSQARPSLAPFSEGLTTGPILFSDIDKI